MLKPQRNRVTIRIISWSSWRACRFFNWNNSTAHKLLQSLHGISIFYGLQFFLNEGRVRSFGWTIYNCRVNYNSCSRKRMLNGCWWSLLSLNSWWLFFISHSILKLPLVLILLWFTNIVVIFDWSTCSRLSDVWTLLFGSIDWWLGSWFSGPVNCSGFSPSTTSFDCSMIFISTRLAVVACCDSKFPMAS